MCNSRFKDVVSPFVFAFTCLSWQFKSAVYKEKQARKQTNK